VSNTSFAAFRAFVLAKIDLTRKAGLVLDQRDLPLLDFHLLMVSTGTSGQDSRPSPATLGYLSVWAQE
jgi:hypothetical protein